MPDTALRQSRRRSTVLVHAGRHRRARLTALLLPLVVTPLSARAQDPAADPGGPGQLASADVGALAVRLFAGGFDFVKDERLPSLDGRGAVGLGATWFPPSLPPLAVDFELLSVARSYDNDLRSPILVSVSDKTEIDTGLATAGVRLRLPPASPVAAHAAGGIGYVWHTIRVSGALLGILPGTVAEDRSIGLVPYFGFGADARLGKWGLSVDYRRFAHRAEFDEPFDLPALELGGAAVLVGASWYPRQ